MKQILLKMFNAKSRRAFKAGQQLFVLSLASLLLTMNTFAQTCPTSGTTTLTTNPGTYFPGTQSSVAAGATSITVGASGTGTNFGSTAIANGDIVLIIQMQGAMFTLPASNTNAGYGDGTGLGSGLIATNLQAGHMEFATATNSVTTAGGTLNLAAGLTYSYTNSAASATAGQYTYQVIRVGTYYNITLGSTVSAPRWNGSVGGVLVINAVNTLNMNGMTLSADAAGFRGGGGKQGGGNSTAVKTEYYTTSTFGPDGSKGEGIAGTPRYINNNNALVDNVVEGYPGGSYSRGAPGNAGGGATDSNPTSNNQNAGGGGGGNGGAGGLGGNGWYSFGFSGGHGGSSFKTASPTTTYASPSRLIMGGGGGSGDTNDGTGTPGGGIASSGAAGGGLIIVNATAITGTGIVTALGGNANNTVLNDASGGGGAGGSILIYANSGQSGITALANGGNGGSNYPGTVGATQHGPGGGGGGGVIFSNAALNASSSAVTGAAGISIGTNATDAFGASGGNNGVNTQTFPFSALPPNMQTCQITILPVTILNFTASYTSANNADLDWKTTNEINASEFIIERSENGADFSPVGQVAADQNGSSSVNNYTYTDNLAGVTATTVFYRLRVVDADGKYVYSKVVPIKLDQSKTAISVYPNPVVSSATLSVYSAGTTTAVYRLFDNAGKLVAYSNISLGAGTNSIPIDRLESLSTGIYILQVVMNNNVFTQKLIKK